MYEDEYYNEEDNIHYISDQDSTDEKPQIENIIKETSKNFKNESDFITILLSEHYRDFRVKFFERIKYTDKSIYQGIKKEIRNILNPYRIHFKKQNSLPNELIELYELLKGYYKEKYFNNTFFINYFLDLEKRHKEKSKFVTMLPKDEVEILNDIECKVKIIKNLRHYLNTTIADLIQINFDQKKELFENDYFIMKYKYLVIDEEVFSKMKEEEIFKFISNKKSSYKLRRPLNDFNIFNYIPILCKGYCQKEAEMFIDKFNKSIIGHVGNSNCERCIKIKENLDTINSQIKSLYLKSCIFSHNINEIMFHPLMFFSLEVYLPFYKKHCSQKQIDNIYKIVQENSIPKRFRNLKSFDIQNIYNPSDVGMKKIFNILTEYAAKRRLFGNCCYLSEYKTSPCEIIFKPNNNDYYEHMKKCPNYHSNLDRRRIDKILENEICKDVIEDGKWKTDDDEIHCSKKDFCNKYHTRNELFFDEKNYRKLYPCCESYYCEKGNLCPKKHAIDIKIEEIFLPFKNKAKLEKELSKLIKKDKKIKNKLDKFSKVICKSCLNFIDGTLQRNLYQFPCSHIICSNCFNYYSSCPLCCLNDKDQNEYNKNVTLIKLDENLNKIYQLKEKNKKKRTESDDSEDSKSDKSSDSDSSEDKKEFKKSKKDESEENSEESSEEENYGKDDEMNLNYDDNTKKLDKEIDMSDVNYPESKNDVYKLSEDKEKDGKDGHIRKGVKRGKNRDNRDNDDSRYNNNYNNHYNNNSYYENSYNRYKNYNNSGRGKNNIRGRYRQRGRGRYARFNNYNSYYRQINEDNEHINDYSENSNYRKGNEYNKGGGRGKKRNYNESEYESKEESKLSNSNENEDEDEASKVYDYREQFSMRNERKIRGGKSGRGFKRENDFDESSEDKED